MRCSSVLISNRSISTSSHRREIRRSSRYVTVVKTNYHLDLGCLTLTAPMQIMYGAIEGHKSLDGCITGWPGEMSTQTLAESPRLAESPYHVPSFSIS